LGHQGSLLALRCQPHELLGHRAVPKGIAIVGLDSGVKHSVGGSAYANARIAAFMGHRILTAKAGGDFMNGYLANLNPERYRSEFGGALPERMTGKAFLDAYGSTVDAVTTVQPGETYAVRACAEHPIFENARVLRFIDLFQTADETPEGERDALVREAGQLMRASHASYGENCGLGSEETDFIVRETERIGADRGLYGAKITGGGCGGTVAILMRDASSAFAALEEVRGACAARYGFSPRLFRGDSPGAMDWPPSRFDRSAAS
jgi:L-arabinokinase